MLTSREPSVGATFVLRCWLEGSNWRYSLEEVGTGKRQGFAGLDEFVSFLLARENLPGDRKIARRETDTAGFDSLENGRGAT